MRCEKCGGFVDWYDRPNYIDTLQKGAFYKANKEIIDAKAERLREEPWCVDCFEKNEAKTGHWETNIWNGKKPFEILMRIALSNPKFLKPSEITRIIQEASFKDRQLLEKNLSPSHQILVGLNTRFELQLENGNLLQL